MHQEIFRKEIVFDRLFHYLWYKEDNAEDPNLLKVRVPHTVIFKNGQPIYWYYSDKTGQIRRKKQQNLKKDKIVEGKQVSCSERVPIRSVRSTEESAARDVLGLTRRRESLTTVRCVRGSLGMRGM